MTRRNALFCIVAAALFGAVGGTLQAVAMHMPLSYAACTQLDDKARQTGDAEDYATFYRHCPGAY